VRRADMIVVMDKGRIVQRGTHKELLRHAGLYRQIYDLQLKGHEKFAEEMDELGQKDFLEPRRRSEELR
jgi:ABC-type enterochelin transport system ATPase subunit